MEKYFSVIRFSPLFDGIYVDAMRHILCCLEARVQDFDRGEVIYHYGDVIDSAGIVLEGKVALVAHGFGGEESSIQVAVPPQSFGCAHSCLIGQKSENIIEARKKAKVMFVKLSRLLRLEAIGCRYVAQMTANLVKQIAAENLEQGRRIHVMGQKSIRRKLLMHLEQSATKSECGLSSLSRQELADYLGTDRSALCREIGKMRDEGFIDCCRNAIKIVGKN